MLILLFIVYSFLQFQVGRVIFRRLCNGAPKLLEVVGSFVFGVFVGIPMTYVLSCLFAFTGEPLLWGMGVAIAITIAVSVKYHSFRIKYLVSGIWHRKLKIRNFSDLLLLTFSFVFSSWLMFKTFRGGIGGQLFVGSNNVFDFGLFIGLVRSMSWGGNIPLMSPFFAGLPFFYHFFFQFWVSLWEYVGIPIVYAVNVPSILSFSALLIIIYYLPQVLLNKGKRVGWIAVILTVTHSTLTFWHLIMEKGLTIQLMKDIWVLPSYSYAGPFDGSVISIFTTLNSFVNQRHLAFGVAMGLLLYMIAVRNVEQKKMTIRLGMILGFLTGLLVLWNMAICLLLEILIALLFVFYKTWKALPYFLLGSALLIFVSLSPYIPFFLQTVFTVNRMIRGAMSAVPSILPSWTLGQFLWENFGILPIIIFLGFIVLSKKGKIMFLPLLLLFFLECFLAGLGKRGFDQKFYSFLIIGVNVVSAIGIMWLWEKKVFVYRALACFFFFTVTISGVVDLMAIKNEFAFPFVNKETALIISWIRDNTPKHAVFVSYSDIIDPVALAGRTNYFGFFGNVGQTDRSPEVKNIYAGDVKTARELGVSYILAPKWDKSDFPYVVDTMYFQEHRMVAYEDERFTVYQVSGITY